MDKLKWTVAICAILALIGLAVVSMTGQYGLNRDSFFVAVFGSLTIVLGLSLLARTLLRRRNRSNHATAKNWNGR
jgi:Ca2+/H+ antiporter